MWKEVSEARYDEALGVLSPAIWLGKGFLMGEPHDHRPCTVTNKIGPTYAAFIQALGRYYEGDPMRSSHRSMDVCYFAQSGTHQSTLHLSFKIKCCVDGLRPPGQSGKHMLVPSSSQLDP